MSDTVIRTENLTKTFKGDVRALCGMEMSVSRGAVYGLIGRNGAGKTTTLRILMGILEQDDGTARILDEEMRNAPREVKMKVGYVSQSQRIYEWMTLEELCVYLSHFYTEWDNGYARELIQRFELASDRQISTMSGGEQRKASMVCAFAAKPEILILDEPAAGLDPVARRQFADEIIDIISDRPESTVLFSTHILSDLERVADHVGVMDKGQMVLESSLESIQSSTKRVQLIFEGESVPDGFSIPGAVRMKQEGPVINAVIRDFTDSLAEELKAEGDVRVNVFPIGLEDMFVELFGPEIKKELKESE